MVTLGPLKLQLVTGPNIFFVCFILLDFTEEIKGLLESTKVDTFIRN